jgi:exodeoxyribonuclease X
MTDWASMRYAVVDVEGNGQQPPELVEVAVVPIVDGVIGDAASWLVRPARPISRIATRIHGLTSQAPRPSAPSRVTSARPWMPMSSWRITRTSTSACCAATWAEWECQEVFDTLKLARRLLPGQATYKLGALLAALGLADGLPAGLAPHRATYDALVTARLFVRIAASGGRPLSLDDLRAQGPGKKNDEPSLF